jgi:serine protease AprX
MDRTNSSVPRRSAEGWTRRFAQAASAPLLVLLLLASMPARSQASTAETPGTPATASGADGAAREPRAWRYAEGAAGLAQVAGAIGADALWERGYTGEGVGVALVDTGVVPVRGLTSGNVSNGPDLSFESQVKHLRYLDTFGHGTHLAGIIAGRDKDGRKNRFQGIAPDARLVSLKVAASDGGTDVSQVIAAIDWVVQHRDDPGLNIRVLNLSFGTDGVQDYRTDPLTHAVENAWRHGIVVVVAAGNAGVEAPRLNNPAYDPHVISVAAADTHGTVTPVDDTVATFSSRGDARRRADLAAPGQSIASLRNPGSYIDEAHPGARIEGRYFKGSGTSQAAAVVSGAIALLLEQRPELTPDQVKRLITASASPMPAAGSSADGARMLNVARASRARTPKGVQRWDRSTGIGSLEAARGSHHVADGAVELTGERHVLGPWDTGSWAAASAAGRAWTGGTWNGAQWIGECWCGESWAGRTWSAKAWSGRSWAGRSWAGRSWAGRSWAGRSWAVTTWTGRSWTGRSWTAVWGDQ